MRFNNDKIFILQQYRWHCSDCNFIEPVSYTCETCFTLVNVKIDNFTQCKQCFKITHVKCITSNICLTCLPVAVEYEFPSVISVNNDFYSSLPYFSPFDFYCNEVINFVPGAETLSDNLQHCNEILHSCEYFTCNEFNHLDSADAVTFLSLNIDGFKTNFDTFLVHHNEFLTSKSKKVDGYFMCETNVTENECQKFSLNGYNSFVLDRILNHEGNLKHKGSGLAVFLHENFSCASKVPELCISDPNFELLCIDIDVKIEKLFVICCYRSPSGDFDTFIDRLNGTLEKLNNFKELVT